MWCVRGRARWRRGALAVGTALCLSVGAGLAGCSAEAPSAPSSVSITGADVMFAQMMIPHHEQAVDMTTIVLAKPDLDSSIAALAKRIADAQEAEIAEMRGLLASGGGGESRPLAAVEARPWRTRVRGVGGRA